MSTERDYPVGHPASVDYKGEKYTPPRAPFSEDFAPGHPARGGKNIAPLDSPDGMRANVLEIDKANAERTAEMESGEAQADGEQQPEGSDVDIERWLELRRRHQP